MSSYAKTTRYALITLAVMGAGFWASVTFLGENWSDQGHYVLVLFNLLLGILLCAGLLLAVLKLVGLAWNKVMGTATVSDGAEPPDATSDHNPQP